MAIDDTGTRTRRALEALGGHPSGALGLDLATPAGRARWLALARLASERDAEDRRLAAFRALDAACGTTPDALRRAGPARVANALAEAGLRRPELVAAGLCHAAVSLAERHAGDLEALAAACLDLEELGARLASLAPGFGAAGVLRFLRPLREHWSAARETPLADTARAAALHLGLVGPSEDLDGEPAAFAAALARHASDLAPADVEAALERLGARACRPGHSARCPLGDACPARGPLPG